MLIPMKLLQWNNKKLMRLSTWKSAIRKVEDKQTSAKSNN
nr:MAG TPA: hypothetical protein [Caudoviricetes sp.]